MLKLAHKIHGRAIARVGELLAQIPPGKGGRPKKTTETDHSSFETRKQSAADADLSEYQAVQALRMANVPEETREAMLEERVPINQIADLGRKLRPPPEPAKPLFDLEGIDPAWFKQATALTGAVRNALDAFSRVTDAGCAFHKGMKPHEKDPFLTKFDQLITRLEAIRDEIE